MTKKLFISAMALLCALIIFNLYQIQRLSKISIPQKLVLLMTDDQTPLTKDKGPITRGEITIHLRAVGDVMMGRSVATRSLKHGDWRWPFQAIVPQLSPTDLLIGNLEFPFVEGCPYRDDGMIFCAPPAAVAGLSYAGFSLVSLANNHSNNYGAAGIKSTEAVLSNAGITSLKDFQTAILQVKNIPLGFIGLNDTYEPLDGAKVTEAISNLKSKTAAVIVLIHWGTEYEPNANHRQQQLAETIRAAGASIILGSHPHVVEPIDTTPTSVIAYSLGNFVFDQMWSDETRKGLILDLNLEFKNQALKLITLYPKPIVIYEYGQPRLD